MIKVINVKSVDALKQISEYKNNKYVMHDVRFKNVHLREINKLIGSNLFSKNDLFINSEGLWELMQPKGEKGGHNHHDLSQQDILDALNNIISPYCIFTTKQNRLSIILSCLCHEGEPIMAIVEIGAGLIDNEDANINKLITMYPKRDIEKLISSINPKRLLYINKL